MLRFRPDGDGRCSNCGRHRHAAATTRLGLDDVALARTSSLVPYWSWWALLAFVARCRSPSRRPGRRSGRRPSTAATFGRRCEVGQMTIRRGCSGVGRRWSAPSCAVPLHLAAPASRPGSAPRRHEAYSAGVCRWSWRAIAARLVGDLDECRWSRSSCSPRRSARTLRAGSLIVASARAPRPPLNDEPRPAEGQEQRLRGDERLTTVTDLGEALLEPRQGAAETTARRDALTMLGSMPTPHSTRSPTAHSTKAAALRVPTGGHRVLGVVEHPDVDVEACQGVDERRDRAVAVCPPRPGRPSSRSRRRRSGRAPRRGLACRCPRSFEPAPRSAGRRRQVLVVRRPPTSAAAVTSPPSSSVARWMTCAELDLQPPRQVEPGTRSS